MRDRLEWAALAALVAVAVACSDDATSPDDGVSSGGAAPTGTTSSTVATVASTGSASSGTGGEAGAPPSGPTSIPSYFRLTAEAAGIDRGIDVACSLDFIFELDPESLRTEILVEYPGTHGGSAIRTVLDESGDGFSFHADVFGEVLARLTFESSALEIEIPINGTAAESFWQELAYFPGMLETGGIGSGTWTCAPLEIDQGGYLDVVGTVDGTWVIEPIDR